MHAASFRDRRDVFFSAMSNGYSTTGIDVNLATVNKRYNANLWSRRFK